MRLNKYIAAAGICSRRKADELIANGNVKVNGAVVQQMGVDVGEDDVVMVNGKVLEHRAQKKVYVAVNKPLGYITSMDDDKGRATVAELVADDAIKVEVAHTYSFTLEQVRAAYTELATGHVRGKLVVDLS